MNEAFEVLKREVETRGLYKRDYFYYGGCAFACLLGVTLSLFFLSVTVNMYAQISNALFLAVVLVQAGMLAHDLSHNQVFASRKMNAFFATFVWGFFGGMSESQWYLKHNSHHNNVNKIGSDPDLAIPFLFSEEQAKESSWVLRKLILPYQHILFFLALPFIYLQIVVVGFMHILNNISLRRIVELGLMFARFSILLFLAFHFLPTSVALVFLVVHVSAVGTYMSLVFAPNHKGKPIVKRDEEISWINQIVSTRNIKTSVFVFQAFGGLNFQIEHHLFPAMARTRYFHTQALVKNFCRKNNLPYDEVTWARSMRDIYLSLKTVSKLQPTIEANQTQNLQHLKAKEKAPSYT